MLVNTALLILAVGVAWRLLQWLRSPETSRIALHPAPITRSAALRVLGAETLLFRSLWRGDRLCWALSMALHGGLVLILVWHLDHFLGWAWLPMAVVRTGGALTLAACLGLAVRRVVLIRIRRITTISDHLHLLLLATLAGAGSIGLGHAWLAALLFVIFPFSKLMHGPAAFLAGTRRRHMP